MVVETTWNEFSISVKVNMMTDRGFSHLFWKRKNFFSRIMKLQSLTPNDYKYMATIFHQWQRNQQYFVRILHLRVVEIYIWISGRSITTYFTVHNYFCTLFSLNATVSSKSRVSFLLKNINTGKGKQ